MTLHENGSVSRVFTQGLFVGFVIFVLNCFLVFLVAGLLQFNLLFDVEASTFKAYLAGAFGLVTAGLFIGWIILSTVINFLLLQKTNPNFKHIKILPYTAVSMFLFTTLGFFLLIYIFS